MSAPRIGLVHERFTEYGGSEAVVAEFTRTWPGARVFAPIVDVARSPAPPADNLAMPWGDIEDTWLTRAHAATGRRSHAPLLPFAPRAFRGLPLTGRFDAVVVSHHAFATQAVFATDAPVVAYVHSPARWAWDRAFRAQEGGGRAGQLALTGLGHIARRAELRAAPHLTRVIANSHAVAERVQDWWGLPATVVNPPVRLDRFALDPTVEREDFFLFAGRLVPYKRPDLAIRAARRAGCRLMVVGDGRFRRQLEELAGPETTFLGAAPDEVLVDMYRRCRALLMPGIEDFGIVPVEAMACGTPVLAVSEGGALDTVRPGVTGEYVPPGSDEEVVEHLAQRMTGFDSATFDSSVIRAHAESFGPASFRDRVAAVVADVLEPGRVAPPGTDAMSGGR
ncbi:glycosyltransferase [Nocardia sp. NPDC057668]|uniref:glycosyltransferase n=1 Tax=Nocardia sp. NPDC057668 TaxID=3346202 RepID=UPI00366D8B43